MVNGWFVLAAVRSLGFGIIGISDKRIAHFIADLFPRIKAEAEL